MSDVLEARRDLEQARADTRALLARKRARLGKALIDAREKGGQTQRATAAALGVVEQQVRVYEQAYRDWAREHPGQEP